MKLQTAHTGSDAHHQPLNELVIDGDLPSLQLHTQHELVNYRDKHGSSLCHYAAGCGHLDICQYLLQIMDDVDANIKSCNNERTPLHWAARNGHLHICKLLVLNYNVPVDTLAKGDVTPLELAIWQCHLTTAKYLVEKLGANPHHPNSWGCTTAHWLGKCAITDNVELLEEACDWLFGIYKVKYNTPNHHGQTPLHKAAYAGSHIVAKYLVLQLGVIDNLRDNHGNNAADCAERSQNYELAKWLRRHASVELHRAIQTLGLQTEEGQSTTTPPCLERIREAYVQLAKVYHPDVSSATTNSNMQKWDAIRDAYQLLQCYHDDESDNDADTFDCQIRILTRNSRLIENERLCWYPSWHDEQQASLLKENHVNNNDENENELAEFQSRLVRLLSNESFIESGLCLAQLPKEYEKNYHMKLPKPRDYGCRKLIQLLQTHCPNIAVDVMDSTKQAMLRVAVS